MGGNQTKFQYQRNKIAANEKKRSLPRTNTARILYDEFDDAIIRSIECPICFEVFDENRNNIPCTLTCGHSICMKHIGSGNNGKTSSSCPLCRCRVNSKDVKKSISLLSHTNAIISLLEASSSSPYPGVDNSRNNNINKYRHNQEETMCPICWLQFDDKTCTPCTISACGHSFCLSHKKKLTCCPVCRGPLPTRPLIKSVALADASVRLQALLSSLPFSSTNISQEEEEGRRGMQKQQRFVSTQEKQLAFEPLCAGGLVEPLCA